MSSREYRVTPRKERMSPQSAGARGELISAAHRFCDKVEAMILARVCEALSLLPQIRRQYSVGLINSPVVLFVPSSEEFAVP